MSKHVSAHACKLGFSLNLMQVCDHLTGQKGHPLGACVDKNRKGSSRGRRIGKAVRQGCCSACIEGGWLRFRHDSDLRDWILQFRQDVLDLLPELGH